MESISPTWDGYVDWSLLLERPSFLYRFLSVSLLMGRLVCGMILGWWADHCLKIPRFHLRANLGRATAVFFTTPEIK